jgi:hypothetical protein
MAMILSFLLWDGPLDFPAIWVCSLPILIRKTFFTISQTQENAQAFTKDIPNFTSVSKAALNIFASQWALWMVKFWKC